MNSATSIRIEYDALRVLSYTGISNTYAPVGTVFLFPIRMLKITNTTDSDILVTFGTSFFTNENTDLDVVPAKSAYIYDYCSNRADKAGLLEQSAGSVIYVRTVTGNPTLGAVYATVIHVTQTL